MDHWNREREKLVGSCFDGEPRRTLCIELKDDDTVIPNEAYAVHGEEENEVDTGIPRIRDDNGKMFGKHCEFTSWVGYVADLKDRQTEILTPENLALIKEQDEQGLLELEEETCVVMAGVKLIEELELTRVKAMYHVVGIYLNERMDAVIYHCLNHKSDKDVVEAVLEFSEKMRKYFPEISKKTKNRLIADAQMEQQLQRRTSGPAYRLGKAIFDGHWRILLRT